MEGLLKADNAEGANNTAVECVGKTIKFKQHPGVRFNIIVSERPIPRGGHVEIKHGREFMVIPVNCPHHGKQEIAIPIPHAFSHSG